MNILKTVGLINEGGFGKIEKILCDDGKEYAKKTFSPSSQFSMNKPLLSKLKQRFIREVKTQKRLPEELFIPVLFEDLTSDEPWFIMPLADKVYTEEILSSKEEFRTPEGLADILNSLEFIHNKGLVHRDLKPQNILLHNNVWKLADFGLISQDKDILSQAITTSNNAYGTAMYCAPEQTTDFKRVTLQADIYSFGAILHDIFTDGKRVPYSELKGGGEIGIIIEKCTKNNIQHRFKSIKSLRDRLLYILSKDNKSLTTDGEEWISSLKNLNTWKYDKFENFIFYLNRDREFWDSAFFELNSDTIDILYEIDKELFNNYSLMYLEWVHNRGFNFDYCDVIIGYLHKIYSSTLDLEIKAKTVIVAAELAKSHNRWYVMRYVIKMANIDIDENLAFRISLELELDDKNPANFTKCAQGINLTVSSYHPIIYETLNNNYKLN